MNRLFALALALLLPATLSSAERKQFFYDCEAWEIGDPPEEVFVVNGSITVQAKDGGKALKVAEAPLDDCNALLGDSANGGASIQAKAFASKQGRRFPRFGVGIHGQSGYRLLVFPVKKELQLTRGEEVIKTIPFDWTSEVWLNLKLEASKGDDDVWTISAKAWEPDTEEPDEPLLTHQDMTMRGQGRCSIWATPYSGTPVYFDDIKVEVE